MIYSGSSGRWRSIPNLAPSSATAKIQAALNHKSQNEDGTIRMIKFASSGDKVCEPFQDAGLLGL